MTDTHTIANYNNILPTLKAHQVPVVRPYVTSFDTFWELEILSVVPLGKTVYYQHDDTYKVTYSRDGSIYEGHYAGSDAFYLVLDFGLLDKSA